MSRKFDVKAVYTKADFISIFEEVKAEIDPKDPFMSILDSNITWAKNHPDDTIFEWKIQPDGTIVPEAYVQIRGNDLFNKLKATE